ncbi:MAG: S9 family peptidase, partial [Ktedonobacterales bacterium]
VARTVIYHNTTLVDDYAWLEDKTDPQVIAYLEAENSHSRAVLRHTEPLQAHLFQELRARMIEDDSSVPQRRGEYWYYWRYPKGKQYRVYCRKQGSAEAAEQILIDENELAEGREYCRVAIFEPSPDQNLLAWSVDLDGGEVFDLFIQDMRTGEPVTERIRNTGYSVAWASDSQTLFYTVFDQAHRPYKLFRHSAGQDQAADQLVYHEQDASFNLVIHRTRSGSFLLLTAWSHTTSEVHFLPATRPDATFQIIHPRQHWMEYYVDHHGDRFLIRTNDRAENFKLVEAPVETPSKDHWRDLVPERPDTLIEGIDPFRHHLAVYERQNGLRRIRISDSDGVSGVRYVSFPEPVYTFQTEAIAENRNPEFDTTLLRFNYSSLVTPDSIVDYDLVKGTWEVKKRQEIPSGYDPSPYQSERLMVFAPDGVQVPLSLVYRKDRRQDGNGPLLLHAYGAYGICLDPGFDSRRLSLLDRGFVYAIAHVRGGSELGRAWYDSGRLMHKKNSFTDLISCAEHLIAKGYTTAGHLAVQGVSAGGLLVAAVTNMRPDLFKAVVALVPFTNVITAMFMPELPLTVVEYEEWGRPDDPQAFEYMLSYSPYENIEAKDYPHIYARTGLNDTQVPYWDPAKWVAKLRAFKTDRNRLVLVTNMGAGHGGASGRFDHLREDAQVYAFLIDTLGVPTEAGSANS